jgi:hypothetical protein
MVYWYVTAINLLIFKKTLSAYLYKLGIDLLYVYNYISLYTLFCLHILSCVCAKLKFQIQVVGQIFSRPILVYLSASLIFIIRPISLISPLKKFGNGA